MKQEHVIVGMSGGVDSSVSAYLLQQQGYHVSGLFMKNWEADDSDDHCSAAQDLADAQAVSAKLGIKLHTVNFSKEYWERVFSYFLEEYQAGRTPNPDILCNKEIKFKAFLNHAKDLGADYIATGHYVRKREINGQWQLLRGLDNTKDQSYFLYTLGQSQLAASLFPVGELEKTDVRAIAEELNLITHDKKDSTGICFIGERHFKTFLKEYLLAQPGPIKLWGTDTVLGQHDGLMYYTLGQRRGLALGGQRDADEKPWYVTAKDVENNILWVAQGYDHPSLFANGLQCHTLDWVADSTPELPLTCTAKHRYQQIDTPCVIKSSDHDNMLDIEFTEPQRAMTPGQSVVFYDDEQCLGGGVIDTIL